MCPTSTQSPKAAAGGRPGVTTQQVCESIERRELMLSSGTHTGSRSVHSHAANGSSNRRGWQTSPCGRPLGVGRWTPMTVTEPFVVIAMRQCLARGRCWLVPSGRLGA